MSLPRGLRLRSSEITSEFPFCYTLLNLFSKIFSSLTSKTIPEMPKDGSAVQISRFFRPMTPVNFFFFVLDAMGRSERSIHITASLL